MKRRKSTAGELGRLQWAGGLLEKQGLGCAEG